jgi:hypothetical protein
MGDRLALAGCVHTLWGNAATIQNDQHRRELSPKLHELLGRDPARSSDRPSPHHESRFEANPAYAVLVINAR